MNNVRKLMLDRDAAYRANTDAVFKAINDTVTKALCEFLKIHSDQILWAEVKPVKNDAHPMKEGETFNFALMVATVNYRAGDQVFQEASNSFSIIDEPVSTSLRMLLPMNVVEEDSSEKITEFFYEIFGNREKTSEPDPAEKLRQQFDKKADTITTSLRALSDLGFDTTLLNGDQLHSIVLEEPTGNERVVH